MVRFCVREFVEQHAPHLTMTEVGRLANISQDTIVKIWKRPENTDVKVSTLIPIARALSSYLGRKVKITELLEDTD